MLAQDHFEFRRRWSRWCIFRWQIPYEWRDFDRHTWQNVTEALLVHCDSVFAFCEVPPLTLHRTLGNLCQTGCASLSPLTEVLGEIAMFLPLQLILDSCNSSSGLCMGCWFFIFFFWLKRLQGQLQATFCFMMHFASQCKHSDPVSLTIVHTKNVRSYGFYDVLWHLWNLRWNIWSGFHGWVCLTHLPATFGP